GVAAYRAEFEPVARAALAAAVAHGGEAVLRDVALRFPGTLSGDEATYRLACLLWDHGNPRAASARLDRLGAHPPSPPPSPPPAESASGLEPPRGVLSAACLYRLGDVERARSALAVARGDSAELVMSIAGAAAANLLDEQNLARFVGRLRDDQARPATSVDDW